MRLTACLPLALLLAGASAQANSPQISWKSSSTTSMTLVDALGADPDYTSLLRLLQRARLIPTLNRLNGSTLLAPTNDAIEKHSSSNSLWRAALADHTQLLPDNIQEQLRQQLFYHLLNSSLLALPTEEPVSTYRTLLYPRKPLDPPSREPPPSLPWMPIPNGTLGHEPQRLRIAAHGSNVNVGVDSFGKGGANVVKELVNAGNGILLGIGQVLEPPPDLATVISQHTSISYFNQIMTDELIQHLNSTSKTTLFLPINGAWEALDPIERLYLESEFASDDMRRILNMHSVVSTHVTWSDSFESGLNLITVEGTTLEVDVTPEGTKVGDAALVQPDIYASNGVLHLVSSLLLPPGALKLTPEKYLLALDCTKFVSLLHSVELTGLINDTETSYTILAPKDDILSLLGPEVPEPGSDELKKLLQYHFIPGKWTPSKLQSGGLLETELLEPGLNNGRQVLPVEVQKDDSKKKSDDKSITFGGASVIGKPISVKNALIYFVSRLIVPPPDALQVALPSLDLSVFLAAVFATTKADLLRTSPNTSLLIPRNEAFKRLGLLVSGHLLAPSSKDSKEDLENVIMHHALNTVEYAYSFNNGPQHSFATLEGTDLKIDRHSNGTLYVSSSGGWPGLKSELIPKDMLTQTGVIHELSDVMIPRSVELTIGKLVKAAKGSTMATLLNKAGYEWILNGTKPPEGSPWFDEKHGNVGWTLLCPPDEAFKNLNLTQLYSDTNNLQNIVAQHLIPTLPFHAGKVDISDPLYNNQPLILEDATYSSIRSSNSAYGDLLFERRADTKEYVVGIKGARGTNGKEDAARVLSWGRSTTGSGYGGVIQIDRLLTPYQPSWWFEYGAPTFVGGLGVFLICAFFYGVRIIWKRDTTEATYEPVGGFGRDDDP